ncbi:hypothetical protein [Streptomyces sp. NPDC004296]|uniref:hypothetical protein n=1 Tax=Streptomyces sp. NPDC004296 TaxID=3364697 RepID=UPI0036BE7FB8
MNAGLSHSQARQLQATVDHYLAKEPGAVQVSANKIDMKGHSLTVAAPGQHYAHDLADPAKKDSIASCAPGHLCIYDGGLSQDYYTCGTYDLNGWTGNGTFVNSQTQGTVAQFLNKDYSVRWSSTAPDSGTATWDPIWHVRPCGTAM